MPASFLTIPELYALYNKANQTVCTDTRRIVQDSVFFALKGASFNANEFAPKAIGQGCRYAIVDEAAYANGETIFLVADVLTALQELATFHRRQLDLPVIGITGSNGKTTNKELIHAVLSKKYNTYATKGNLNNHIGVPLTLLELRAAHEMAVVEMGANHQGEIDFLCGLAQPNYGLITNIGKAHLEGFGGEEGVKKGKSELYKHLEKHGGTVFVNANDPVLMELVPASTPKVLFGDANPELNIYGHSFRDSDYVEMQWAPQHEAIAQRPRIKTQMFGHYNYINLLCAACIGHYFGVPEKDINRALADYVPEMNRSQVVKTERNTVILDAYNANPSSMKAAVENFAAQTGAAKLVILGDMFELGIYAEAEHAALVSLVAETKLRALFVGPLFYANRKELPGCLFFNNVADCTAFLKQNPPSNNMVLIKGSRGMKLEQVLESL